ALAVEPVGEVVGEEDAAVVDVVEIGEGGEVVQVEGVEVPDEHPVGRGGLPHLDRAAARPRRHLSFFFLPPSPASPASPAPPSTGSLTASSSTSNTRVALGGIFPDPLVP